LSRNAAGGAPQWAARSSTNGISVDSHGLAFSFAGSPLQQLLVRLRLRLPPAMEIFSSLLAHSGATLEESDKGRYTRRMSSFGATSAPSARTCRMSQPLSAGLLGVEGNRWRPRPTIRTESISDWPTCRRLPRRLTLRLARSSTVTNTNRSWGVECMRCQLCAGTSFYRLEDIGPGFQCARCRRYNEIARSTWRAQGEPEWYYSLDEVAYQGLSANIHVPILALHQLAGSARSFLHMPEAVVHRPGHSDIEVDLWAVSTVATIVGEAKVSDRLEFTAAKEGRRCADLEQLVKDLTADEFVLATASPAWSERTQSKVSASIGRFVRRWLTNLA
jgi:hypothetical protein